MGALSRKTKMPDSNGGCYFASGRRPSEEGISIWNAFLEMTRAQICRQPRSDQAQVIAKTFKRGSTRTTLRKEERQ
jgi:hypothetical protein